MPRFDSRRSRAPTSPGRARKPARGHAACRALLLALVMGASTMTASAGTSDDTPGMDTPGMHQDGTMLSVSAHAEVTRVPDVATISAGAVTQAADADAAMRANATRMDKVMAAIKAAGVAARDIQTSGVNLGARYNYGEGQAPTIIGYQASNTVNIKLRDIGKLGKVLDALVASGANQINGPSFEVDEPEAAYDQARRAALEQAQARAAMYAKTLGLRVRRIVSISEGGGFQPPRPMPVMAMARGKAQSDTQVSPGETTLGASLDVVFELGR